eukprot:TRINITY_DN981_c0_g1_i2.p1 TRINITY_DN981_c0_g1~~TRINITY_DN981_c0_g1_i2.p1  ORF type:complete len:334 (-),score=71.80 TRINITY_DN981_c0_g1_i2:771-1658(-)
MKAKRARQERVQTSPGGGTSTGRRLSNRLFIVHQPKDATIDVPLLIFLHGSGDFDLWDWVETKTEWVKLADEKGFILLFPEAPGDIVGGRRVAGTTNVWNLDNPQDDLAFLHNVIDEVSMKYPIDVTRIFACGFSTGGLFLTNAVVEFCETWTAAATVLGGMSKRTGSLDPAEATKHIPFAIVTAPEDPMTASCQQARTHFASVGWEPTWIPVDKQERHVWPASIEWELWRWMRRQEKEAAMAVEQPAVEVPTPEKSEKGKEKEPEEKAPSDRGTEHHRHRHHHEKKEVSATPIE